VLAALARPVVEQLQRGARHAGPPRGLPLLQALADAVDQFQLDERAEPVTFAFADRAWRAVVVHRGPSPRIEARRLALHDAPVLGRLVVGAAEDRFGDLEAAHSPNALMIPSSFSMTSGWISSGRMTAAISWYRV